MKGVKSLNFNQIGDQNGLLVSLEEGRDIPFQVKRAYYIFNTKKGVSRGFHSHRKLKQVIVCLSGSCRFILDDGLSREEVDLNSPGEGLLIKGNIWREMHDFSPDCIIMVLADDYYNELDYIRDYKTFLLSVNGK